MTAQLESAQSKAAGADKARKRLQAEVEELTAELDKVISDRGGFRHDMFVYSEVDKTQLGIVNVLYHEPRFLKKTFMMFLTFLFVAKTRFYVLYFYSERDTKRYEMESIHVRWQSI